MHEAQLFLIILFCFLLVACINCDAEKQKSRSRLTKQYRRLSRKVKTLKKTVKKLERWIKKRKKHRTRNKKQNRKPKKTIWKRKLICNHNPGNKEWIEIDLVKKLKLKKPPKEAILELHLHGGPTTSSTYVKAGYEFKYKRKVVVESFISIAYGARFAIGNINQVIVPLNDGKLVFRKVDQIRNSSGSSIYVVAVKY